MTSIILTDSSPRDYICPDENGVAGCMIGVPVMHSPANESCYPKLSQETLSASRLKV